jgi:hypothetical protein
MERKERNLPNHCHRGVDFQSLSYHSHSLITEHITSKAKRKEMKMRAGKRGRKEDEMD